MLENSNVAYTQPLPGKLVVDPPPGARAALTVTFWPAREGLRLGNRPTQRGQGIGEFEQLLADQGHWLTGYPISVSKSDAFERFRHAQAEGVRVWLEQQAALEEAKSALDECILLNLQRLLDFAAGHRLESQNPELREAKRRFRSARRRAMGRRGVS